AAAPAAAAPANGANGATAANGAAEPRAAGTGRPAGATGMPGSGRGAPTRGRLYLLDAEGKPAAYNVRLGVSDGSVTELLVRPDAPNAAVLVEGATVVTGVSGGAAAAGATPARAAGPRLAF
ncbi:MAG: hypothetical protein Q8Q82_01630, partial [Hydrogenophaga sp.]|nr:hypothetical protein [Hydrogenophaga sp.]